VAPPLPVLITLLVLGGCRLDLPVASGAGAAERPAASADVQAGTYADDPRWPAFARAWPQRVARAFDRLAVVTGLDFADRPRPRVVLRPFGDERRTRELGAEIVDGRSRSVLRVNAEPLLAGVRDPDRVLLRGLAEAAFEEVARRQRPVAPWVLHLAEAAAAGDLPRRLAALQRHALEEGEGVLRVDPDDPAAAEATGLAALLLLAAQGRPGVVRRTLVFAADGDDAGEAVGRVARQPGGGWAQAGERALRARLATLDATPWRVLGRARTAAREAGRAGFEAALPAQVPEEIADEVHVLRARLALDAGDRALARKELAALGAHAPARLEDPAGALALRVRVESGAGGDARLARRLAAQLDRDYPKSKARRALRRRRPLLGSQEDPEAWLAAMRAHVTGEGTADLDLRTLERYGRLLLADHRAGAAEAFLATLGARGGAPELDDLHQAVSEAQAHPNAAAVARAGERVRAWEARPGEGAAQDVRESGRAARAPLLAALRACAPGRVPGLVGLLAGALGEVPAAAALRGLWAQDPARIDAELPALATAVGYDALRPALDPAGLDEAAAARLARAWSAVGMDLPERWLKAHPHFLAAVRAPAYATRRDAFARIAAQDPGAITPALVARGLRDPAALMRRQALVLAGIAGFPALARRGLADATWLVRAQAVRVVTALDGRRAQEALLRLLATDPSREVRGAAAQGLLEVAPGDDRTVDALLHTQVGPESALRAAVAARLARQPAAPVVRGIVRGWRRALARPKPDPGYLFRTALLFQRLTGLDLGYVPESSPEVRARMVARMQDWLDAQEAAPETPQHPAGRLR
jgi:hypothetical protein